MNQFLPAYLRPPTNEKSDQDSSGGTYLVLAPEKITPNPDQPRKHFDGEKIEELAQSIRTTGILQPILVRPHGSGYQIISGERRYHAACRAGLREIPVVVRTWNTRKVMLAALIENIQRENLNPIEEARALRDILQTHGYTHDQLADILGRSRPAITNLLRTLRLPPTVQELIATGKISSGHAKMLAGLKTDDEVQYWVKRILQENLSVFATENEISRKKEAKTAERGNKRKFMSADLHVNNVEQKLQDRLGAKVKIRVGRSKSVMQIEFYSQDDLERVLESLLPGL
jgi:ParB family chromosome partitioning protein